MKTKLVITIAIFLLVKTAYSQCEPITSFPWSEGFESSDTIIPQCWEQEENVWGGWNWNVVPASTGNPATAHEGNNKAQIFINSPIMPVWRTRLLTPVFDLTAIDKPVLRFWHTQTGGCGGLIVYYKNSLNGEWILLNGQSPEIPDWKETILPLPAPSDYYQIAFLGIFLGGGTADEQLDDISIYDESTINIFSYDIDNYSLIPNPVQDILKITRSNSERTGVSIYNSIGALIDFFETSKSDFQVDVSKYSSGVYFIRMSNGNSFSTKQFIKQ